MKITTVTVTGADQSIEPRDLIEIAYDFPFVEFGILISRGTCAARFPGKHWIKTLLDVLPPEVKLSAHICGGWVREILQGDWPDSDFQELLGPKYFQRFGRFQLNTHGVKHAWSEKFIEILLLPPPVPTIIFQKDGANDEVLAAAKEAGATTIAALFDLSHGAGVLPTSWPAPLHEIHTGYAGGLSPANVRVQARRIQTKTSSDRPTWIDAETHLRSRAGQLFDLGKVREFLFEAEIVMKEGQNNV